MNGDELPSRLRFNVQADADSGVYCNPFSKPLTLGRNQLLFSELLEHCFKLSTMPPNATAETVQSKLQRISWQVDPKSGGTVPFDFCVSNLQAILK